MRQEVILVSRLFHVPARAAVILAAVTTASIALAPAPVRAQDGEPDVDAATEAKLRERGSQMDSNDWGISAYPYGKDRVKVVARYGPREGGRVVERVYPAPEGAPRDVEGYPRVHILGSGIEGFSVRCGDLIITPLQRFADGRVALPEEGQEGALLLEQTTSAVEKVGHRLLAGGRPGLDAFVTRVERFAKLLQARPTEQDGLDRARKRVEDALARVRGALEKAVPDAPPEDVEGAKRGLERLAALQDALRAASKPPATEDSPPGPPDPGPGEDPPGGG